MPRSTRWSASVGRYAASAPRPAPSRGQSRAAAQHEGALVQARMREHERGRIDAQLADSSRSRSSVRGALRYGPLAAVARLDRLQARRATSVRRVRCPAPRPRSGSRARRTRSARCGTDRRHARRSRAPGNAASAANAARQRARGVTEVGAEADVAARWLIGSGPAASARLSVDVVLVDRRRAAPPPACGADGGASWPRGVAVAAAVSAHRRRLAPRPACARPRTRRAPLRLASRAASSSAWRSARRRRARTPPTSAPSSASTSPASARRRRKSKPARKRGCSTSENGPLPMRRSKRGCITRSRACRRRACRGPRCRRCGHRTPRRSPAAAPGTARSPWLRICCQRSSTSCHSRQASRKLGATGLSSPTRRSVSASASCTNFSRPSWRCASSSTASRIGNTPRVQALLAQLFELTPAHGPVCSSLIISSNRRDAGTFSSSAAISRIGARVLPARSRSRAWPRSARRG